MDAQETRRLLELAAKAAGLRIKRKENDYFIVWIDDEPMCWSPFRDDGDSRRLEVALKIHHRQYSNQVQIRGVWCRDGYVEAVSKDIEEREPINGDPRLATRLAVLRVAAAVGEH